MRTINTRLLERNFINFGPYLLSNTAQIVGAEGLTGVPLEMKMVEIEQTVVQNYIQATKTAMKAEYPNSKICFALRQKYGSSYVIPNANQWDCAIEGINRVSRGDGAFSGVSNFFVYVFNGFKEDAFIKAMAVFNARVPFEKYNFLNYDHRVWMGQKMAYYLRNPNAL